MYGRAGRSTAETGGSGPAGSDASHNEFWNMLTDLAPLLAFPAAAAAAAALDPHYAAAPPHVRWAFLLTCVGTALQHAASLGAHTFCCVSAKLSHGVWFVDYAGIAVNFVWNAPAAAFVAWPDAAAAAAPWWAAYAVAATALVVVTTARGPPRHSEPQELFLGPKKYVLLEIPMENIVNNTPR